MQLANGTTIYSHPIYGLDRPTRCYTGLLQCRNRGADFNTALDLKEQNDDTHDARDSLSMNPLFHHFRFVTWIVVASSLVGVLVMSYIGVYNTVLAVKAVAIGDVGSSELGELGQTELATVLLVKSLDAFLIALVLFIFAFGVFSLFISDQGVVEKDEGAPKKASEMLKWVHIPNISHLKNTLAELIVVILFVKFLENTLVSMKAGFTDWTALVLPCAIALLAIALKLLELRHD